MESEENSKTAKGKAGADKIELPNGEKKILLHSCCAPCSAAIIERLLADAITPTIFYFNPNIFPFEEYERRRAECARHCDRLGLRQIDADNFFAQSHSDWLENVKGLESEPERGARCLECFKFRLCQTAKFASLNGFKVFATTLASSRWKDLNQIQCAGEFAQSLYPETIFFAYNWRKGGLQERRNALLKEFDFYNQLYCGCEFSLSKSNNK